MTGSFDFDQREARVRLFIRGAAGMLHGLEAAVDTGFTEELTLDTGLIEALQLPYVLTEQTMLSDGSIVPCAVHAAKILWDGEERGILVQAGEGTPLLGIGLLLGYELRLQVMLGGELQTIKIEEA